MPCIIYIDRGNFTVGEPIYITLVNMSNTNLHIGSWGILDENGKAIYSIKPPQITIGPGSSLVVVWFQLDNEGKQVSKGRYRAYWKPEDGDLECLSEFFDIS
ncbi:MAG: hypothetical protein TU36_003025 [Vulcanisaeta sp. AZ3]|jgi:hypothetical protein